MSEQPSSTIRGKIEIQFFQTKQPEVSMHGDVQVGDIAYVDYLIRLEFMNYSAVLSAVNARKLRLQQEAELTEKKLEDGSENAEASVIAKAKAEARAKEIAKKLTIAVESTEIKNT